MHLCKLGILRCKISRLPDGIVLVVRSRIVGNRQVVLTGLNFRDSTIGKCAFIRWIDLNGGGIVADRRRVLILLQIGVAAIDQGFVISWI